MAIKRLKYTRRKSPLDKPPLPTVGRQASQEHEVLSGRIGDVKASAGEERWARTLSKNKVPFEFRLALGAPRNVPGWFELDFLFMAGGVYRALEVDSAFSHRDKFYKDKLHDAKVLQELNYLGVFPQVYHIDNDQHLASQDLADRTYKELFR